MNKPRIKTIIIYVAIALAICSAAALCICLRPAGCASSETKHEVLSDGDIVSSTDGYASGTDAVSGGDLSAETTLTFPATDDVTTTVSSTVTTTTSKGTSTSATTSATATATEAQALKNAQYVVNPDYKSKYYIVVFAGDSQSVAIYGKDENGAYNVLTKCFTCSTGAKSSPTRTGQYKVWRRFRWRLLVGNVYGQYSTSISSDYLFHSVPYLKQNASALDMAEYDKLGSPASHGCIRLCVRDSKWIYENCPNGTQVNIVNVSGPEGAGYPPRSTNSIYNGWDPSDPDPSNPYIKTPTTTKTTATTTKITTTAKTTTTVSTTVTTTASTAATTTSSVPTTTAESTTVTTTTTTTAAPSRWVNQAEIDRIISNAKAYAESMGMSRDSSLNTSNAYWTPDTKVYTDPFATAADCEARIKSVVSYIYNGNFGYSRVNFTAAEQSSGEYIITCCFA